MSGEQATYQQVFEAMLPVTDGHDKVKNAVEVVQFQVVSPRLLGNGPVEGLRVIVQGMDRVNPHALRNMEEDLSFLQHHLIV